jgi:threonine/homoserine/homoserine lactone efflux protein
MVSSEFLITSLIVVLIPGTGVLYTISIGLLEGRKQSIYAALGCTMGIVPHLCTAILGLSAIVYASALAFQMIKIIGVVYLLYLAYSMWKSTESTFELKKEKVQKSNIKIATHGFLINILNPKLSLFFLSFLPQFIQTDTSVSTFMQMLYLSGIFMLMTFVIFVIYGLFANKSKEFIVNSPRVMNNIKKTFSVFFVLLSAKLAFSDK